VVRELRQRELRDHLRTLDPVDLQARMRRAVADGATSDLLDALGNAPYGFPVAPPELVKSMREQLAQRDNPELEELAQLHNIYERMLGIGEQVVKDISADAGATANIPMYTVSGAPVPEVQR